MIRLPQTLRFAIFLSAAAVISLQFSCRKPPEETEVLCITGSEDLTYIMETWTRTYTEKTGHKAAFEARGNGTVYKDLSEGICNAGVMTRLMTDAELDRLVKQSGKTPERIAVAEDPVTVTFFSQEMKETPKLTVLQARDLFTKGKFTPENGRPDFIKENQDIIIMGQNSARELYRFVKESLLNNEDFADTVSEKPDAETIKAASARLAGKSENQVIVFSYMRLAEAGRGHVPVQLTTGSGTEFSLRRIIYFYTISPEDEKVRSFSDHIRSMDEQNRLSTFGFRPPLAE